MRHGTNGTAGRRPRGRGNGNGGGGSSSGGGRRSSQPRMKVFDSNGPDVRIRGTAHQVCEKYLALAKDASSGGNLVLVESYLQHAEHYQRVINEWAAQAPENAQKERSDNRDTYAGDSKASEATPATSSKEDDLALPSSILGGEAKVETKARTEASEDTTESVE